jgi:stress response protein YsnF
VTKTRVEEQDTQHVSLRKEEVVIERLVPDQTGNQPV